jgi:hypothetical protein
MKKFLMVLFWIGCLLLGFSIYLESIYTKGLVFPDPVPPGVFVESWNIALAPLAYFIFLFIAWIGTAFVLLQVFTSPQKHRVMKLGISGLVYLISSLVNMVLVSNVLFQILIILIPATVAVIVNIILVLIFLSPGMTLVLLAWKQKNKLNLANQKILVNS